MPKESTFSRCQCRPMPKARGSRVSCRVDSSTLRDETQLLCVLVVVTCVPQCVCMYMLRSIFRCCPCRTRASGTPAVARRNVSNCAENDVVVVFVVMPSSCQALASLRY